MSAGVHRLWKDADRRAPRIPKPGETIIDCAGGTGRHGAALRRPGAPARQRRGGADAPDPGRRLQRRDDRRRAGPGWSPEIAWAVGDAQRLPLPDACADAYVISFGIPERHRHPGGPGGPGRVLKAGRAVPVPGVLDGRPAPACGFTTPIPSGSSPSG
jgi:demethylmenaquinone methyltransferase/2-methoxy-6-polyprenyl-1,4-benzoquinol methylase